jgi:hypothetical protein
MAFQRNKTGQETFDLCMADVDAQQTLMLKSAGCTAGCAATNEMLASMDMHQRDDDMQAGPRSVATSGFLVSLADGAANSSTYGVPIIVGDSGCDAGGSTGGETERALSMMLQTTVINNCVGGSTLTDVYKDQSACSSLLACKWSIIMAGMNTNPPSDAQRKGMQDFIARETHAGKHVVILGHPDPAAPHGTPHWHNFMNEYAALATAHANVWFIDARLNPEFKGHDWSYFANDKSHPSPKTSREVFAPAIFAIMKTVSEASVAKSAQGWSVYRFVPLKLRGGAGNNDNIMQLAEIQFRFQNQLLDMSDASASVQKGNSPIGEEPFRAIDGLFQTKWSNFGMRTLYIRFPSSTPIDSYTYVTASDAPARDPVRWRLEGSNDGVTFEVLHEMLQDYYETPVKWFRVPVCLKRTSLDRGQACISTSKLVDQGLAFPATPL